jgi:hypothetical protein
MIKLRKSKIHQENFDKKLRFLKFPEIPNGTCIKGFLFHDAVKNNSNVNFSFGGAFKLRQKNKIK